MFVKTAVLVYFHTWRSTLTCSSFVCLQVIEQKFSPENYIFVFEISKCQCEKQWFVITAVLNLYFYLKFDINYRWKSFIYLTMLLEVIVEKKTLKSINHKTMFSLRKNNKTHCDRWNRMINNKTIQNFAMVHNRNTKKCCLIFYCEL